ncbi:MAG: hypothetical protein ACRCT1_15035 [Microcoleaceae cyanobacterium]
MDINSWIYIGTTLINGAVNLCNQSLQRSFQHDEGERNRRFQRANQILGFLQQQQLAQDNHVYRVDEIYHSAQIQQNLQAIIHGYNKELEAIRSQNTVFIHKQTAVINYQFRQLEQWERNHPLMKPLEETIHRIKETHKSSKRPVVLLAGFTDDTKSDQVNDAGGTINYRSANCIGFKRAKWLDVVVFKDGYFERPLRRSHYDLDSIYSCLSDIPVIIVHGVTQLERRVYLEITHWGILPDSNGYYNEESIILYELPSLTPENKIDELLKIQDQVAEAAVVSTAVLGDIYNLTQNYIRPSVTRYGIKDQEKLQLWAEIFSLYYEVLCEQDIQKEPFLRLDAAVMLDEVGLKKQAREQRDAALSSWCFQRNIDPKIFPNALNREIIDNFSIYDSNFLLKLGKTYQLIGDRQKASEIFALTQKVEEKQPQLIGEISKLALNIEVKNIYGTQVFYELVERFDNLYLLAYWRDEGGYKAGVIEGIDSIATPLVTEIQLTSDGMIDFKTQKFSSLKQIRQATISWLNNYSEYEETENITRGQNKSCLSRLLESRSLSYLEKQEIKNIIEKIPNIDAKEVQGVIVWYEWLKRPNRQYQLAYWHDEEGYKAGVIEGVDPNDLGNSQLQIFADGRLMLDNPTDIISTRFQAITWINNYEQRL